MDSAVSEDWLAVAACRGEGWQPFYPAGGSGSGERMRRKAAEARESWCAGCPVRGECLAASDEWGVWAGLTPRGRVKARKMLAAGCEDWEVWGESERV